MKKHRTTFLALALAALAAGGAAAAPEFDVAKEDERTKLAEIAKSAAAGDDAAVYAMDEVFARLARPGPVRDAKNAPADLLLDEPAPPGGSGVTMRSMRLLALEAARKLPPATRKKLIEAQKDAAATERGRGAEDEDLVRRFPFAPDAAKIAWREAQQAFDEGDETAALSWDRLAARLAALQLQTEPPPLSAHARRCAALIRAGDLDGARAVLRRIEQAAGGSAKKLTACLHDRIAAAEKDDAAVAARKTPEGSIPDLFATYPFNHAHPTAQASYVIAPPIAAHVGDLVFASDGSRLVAVDARTGELRGRLPQSDDEVAPPATGLPGVVAALGDLVVAPLFFETFVLPARPSGVEGRAKGDPDADDPSLRGGYFSLFAYDARGLRMLWWDGDVGTSSRAADETPHGRPAGMDQLDERTWRFVSKLHVVGRPVLDGRRIYVPLASSLSESQLWIAAYEREAGEGGALVLKLAWKTFVSLSSQTMAGQGQNSSVPVVNPRLALDIEGRLFVQTDQGVLAALDARMGGLDWVHRPSDDDGVRRARVNAASYRATSDPPVPFAGDGSKPAVVVMASPEDERWLGLSSDDGSVVWRSDAWTQTRSGGFTPGRGEGPRALALSPSIVLGYGGQTFVAFDPYTGAVLVEPGRVRAVRFEDHERLAGPASRAGPGELLLPTDQGRVRKLAWHEEPRGATREVQLALGDDALLQGVGPQTPVHLMALEGRVVATTPTRVLVYTWVSRND